MSKRIVKFDSQIPTGLRCNNCGINIDQVSWEQCNMYQRFNLCEDCGKDGHDTLELLGQNNHKQLHQTFGKKDSITSKCMDMGPYTVTIRPYTDLF